jgi:Tfp pilus assembly protein PilO
MPPGPGGPGGPGKPPAPGAGTADAGKGGFKINLTKEQQNNLAAAVLISALAIFAYVNYWAKPVLKKYKDQTAVLEQKKKELKDAREMVSKYAEFLARASEINKKVDFINKRLPKDMNIADTIRETTKAAAESSINVINFLPGRETNKGDYKEFAISVTCNTNFRDLGRFLTRVGYIERLTIPGDVIMQKMTDSKSQWQNVSVTLKIKTYSLNE